jgi:phage regulator Rha-like protein
MLEGIKIAEYADQTHKAITSSLGGVSRSPNHHETSLGSAKISSADKPTE